MLLQKYPIAVGYPLLKKLTLGARKTKRVPV
jgi:hypothetical protein